MGDKGQLSSSVSAVGRADGGCLSRVARAPSRKGSGLLVQGRRTVSRGYSFRTGEWSMKDFRYKHQHRCHECGATRTCVESKCIGEGGCAPPEGYGETCAECKARDEKLYAAIIARVDHLKF